MKVIEGIGWERSEEWRKKSMQIIYVKTFGTFEM